MKEDHLVFTEIIKAQHAISIYSGKVVPLFPVTFNGAILSLQCKLK